MDNKNVIEVNNLSVIIKDRFLVKNAYFFVKKGECWGIVGEDRSGKTSLIKAISGSLPINRGQVNVFGSDIFENKKVLTKVSTCFDPPVFFKYQTVYDNMKYISALTGKFDKEEILKTLDKFGIAHRFKTKVMFLPYYEKKLMGLALGFLTKPEILLLDEPFKNLPEENLKQVKTAIDEARKNGSTILISTKNIETIEEVCDNFIFMEAREIKKILHKKEVAEFSADKTYAFISVKYPHFAGKLIMDNFDYDVKLLNKRVLFEADEETTAKIVRFISKHNIAIYNAGYLSRKTEKIFANLTPYFKEEQE